VTQACAGSIPITRSTPLPSRAPQPELVADHGDRGHAHHQRVPDGGPGDLARAGTRQRRGIVDAVAGHRNAPALLLQARHQGRLVLRADLAVYLVEPQAA